MRVRTFVWLLAAALLILNFADFATTWFGLTSGRAVELNGVWSVLGGPLSPAAIIVKLVVVPGAILGVAWLLARKLKDPAAAMSVIAPAAAVCAYMVANNVIVIAKKVSKIAGMKQASPKEVTKT